MKQKDSFSIKYPLTLSNGFIGFGKSLIEKKDFPYFFIQEFNLSKKKIFQPEFLLPSKKFKILNTPNTIYSCKDNPSEQEFKEKINIFLKNKVGLKKIVLARQRCYTFKEKINTEHLLSKLIECFPKKNAFAYSPSKNKLFFGSSPERLYYREGKKITIDSIAGTAKAKDLKNLFSEKNIEEHKFVTTFIENTLNQIASNIKTSTLGLKKAKNLIHLYQTLQATLNEGVKDFDIISALHPTPAVLGFPKREAFDFLKKYENFNRGYYAGCLGWIREDKSLLQVGIRSAVVNNNTLTLFAGAGITKNSNAELEIMEINNKFKTLEEVLFALQA